MANWPKQLPWTWHFLTFSKSESTAHDVDEGFMEFKGRLAYWLDIERRGRRRDIQRRGRSTLCANIIILCLASRPALSSFRVSLKLFILFLPTMSGNSRSREFPGIPASNSRPESREWNFPLPFPFPKKGMEFSLPFPFPKIGNGISHSRSRYWEWNIKVGNRNGKMLKVGLVLGGAIASKKG